MSEDTRTVLSPEEYEKELLDNTDNLTEKQLRDKIIETAELKQAVGDLQGAADFFKQASLLIKGEKDFESLYRSAVLNVEMSEYRIAEADLRAILTFSDNPELRIKAALLTARMKSLQDLTDEAYSIILNILTSSVSLPQEAYTLSADFYEKNKEAFDLSKLKKILDDFGDKVPVSAGLKPMLNPEIIFGLGKTPSGENEKISLEESGSGEAEIKITQEESANEVSAAVQLGSFSKKENAEDLVKSVSEKGYEAVIKIKNVNGKNYFAVTVPVKENQDVQNLIIELKEKGFEGYPVF